MNNFILVMLIGLMTAPAAADMADEAAPAVEQAMPAAEEAVTEDAALAMINVHFDQIEWTTETLPNEQTFEVGTLRSDEATGNTAMMIRAAAGTQVPWHWHTPNEQIIVLEGTLNLESEGMIVALSKGGYHFLPSKVVHRAWADDDEDILIFVAADAPWDINFIEDTVEEEEPEDE